MKLIARLRSRRIIIFVLCGAIALACFFLVSILQSPASKFSALPQHPQIQVFFNHNPANQYTDPYRQLKRPGDNLEQIIIDHIKQAKVSVDVAVQELRLPNIAQALIERKQAGVRVRLILENNYSRAWSEYTAEELSKFSSRDNERYADFQQFADLDKDGKLSDTELDRRDAIRMLKKAELEWLDDTADGSKGSGLMHHKFVVVDKRYVLLGSANFTLSDIHGDFTIPESRGNSNNIIKIDNKEVAELFTKEFNLMWGDGPGGKTDSLFGVKKPHRRVAYVIVNDAQIRLKFSPDRESIQWEQTANGLIGTVVAGGHETIDMALFVFSDALLSNILEIEQQRSVQIRTLIDPSFAYRNYSSALDMWGFASTVTCKLGNKRPWRQTLNTAGIPDLPKGDLLHHKFGIVDSNIVITGSHNWSNNANRNNDEAIIVIQNVKVAKHFQREFERLLQNAKFGPSDKVSKTAPTACSPSSKTDGEQPSESLEEPQPDLPATTSP